VIKELQGVNAFHNMEVLSIGLFHLYLADNLISSIEFLPKINMPKLKNLDLGTIPSSLRG